MDAGPKAARRFVEFFTVNIRNANTRAAYLRAVRKFDAWCQARNLTLNRIEPVAVAAYIEELGRTYPKPTVKQACHEAPKSSHFEAPRIQPPLRS